MKEITSSPFGASLRSDPKLMREFTRALYPSDPLGYCYQLWATVGWSSMPWLWSLRQLTLILSGIGSAGKCEDHTEPDSPCAIIRVH